MATSILARRPAIHDASQVKRATTRRPLRVLHVINGEHYAGAERVQDLLALQLRQSGFEVGFACIKPGKFPGLRQAKQAALYRLPMRHRFDFRPVWKLVRIIRHHGYQLLHAHTPRSALIAGLASLITGVPLVQHVHSPASRDTTDRWRNRINGLLERVALRRASALIAVSESLGRHLRRGGFNKKRVFVVPNGVPCHAPHLDAQGDSRVFGARKSVQSPACPVAGHKQQWTLGTVALFRPRKGLEVLLGALAILRSEGLPVQLRAVGSFETPQYEQQIKAIAAELGLSDAIEWVGFARDVNAELAKMDLFVLPSLFGEGLPMVVLEAMAAGVPVVATRVEGVPEAICHGIDGLLAQPGDPVDLAAALRQVISGQVDRRALGASALRRQATTFSQQSMAAGVAAIYRRVLGVSA